MLATLAGEGMAQFVDAKASPEKRLFISLLTRDLSLVDAFLDLMDNSINSALVASNLPLSSAKDYIKLLGLNNQRKLPKVEISIDKKCIAIEDTAGGISFAAARNNVFVFGRKDGSDTDDRLSVYGIGLKRAIFKMGETIEIVSNHREKGFTLSLDVERWERDSKQPWTLPIQGFSSKTDPFGTKIYIRDLHDDVKTRITDSLFESQLKRRISESYVYFLDRVITARVNNQDIRPVSLDMGENFASETFSREGVTCSIIAGLCRPKDGRFSAENAGWFIFCNGRAVAFANKSQLTGWGSLLPTFQPKHRPFLGLVFFVSDYAERLPWATTKSSINEESLVWQDAKRRMADIGRQVTSFLDRRYGEGGTEITAAELNDVSGDDMSAFEAVAASKRNFKISSKKSQQKPSEETSVQFRAKVKDVERIKAYVGKRNMSNSDVGRYTFDYFLNNEVGEE
jgi:hypothetical protein